MRKRRLSTSEEALWRKVSDSVKPLHPPVGLDHDKDDHDLMGPKKPPNAARRRKLAPPPSPPNKRQKPSANSVIGAGDPQLDKKVRRRRMPIDMTLDLHGMTQAAAQKRLAGFIQAAHHDGCRCVLVITGKGDRGAWDATAYSYSQTDEFDEWARPRRGVLRARFMEWVDAPGVRALISRVAPAHQKDGGGGAWYVFLKIDRKSG